LFGSPRTRLASSIQGLGERDAQTKLLYCPDWASLLYRGAGFFCCERAIIGRGSGRTEHPVPHGERSAGTLPDRHRRLAQYELGHLSGNLDDAARVFIGELDDPTFRTAALHQLQRFDHVPGALAPERWETYWKQLKARPDVKAAIAKYGRIQSYDLPPQ
jgi:hypothetical protein